MPAFRSGVVAVSFHPVEHFGQVFTPPAVVAQMLGLRRNAGRVLEPSCGDGAFARELPGCVAIELDARVAPAGALNMDFFAYPESEKFDSIIGNPPYVRFQDVLPETRARLDMTRFDSRSNLFLFFIEKCVRHLNPGGELIFIVPRDFIKLTAARKLNAWLFEQGTITDFIETGDSNIFGAFVPNCAIFRFEKGRRDRTMSDGRHVFTLVDGQLMFLRNDYSVPLASLFDVKVGAVSGADSIFTHPRGNREFVCSKTVDTGETRRMYYDVQNDHLAAHKEQLLARRVTNFDESNWWKWGRRHHVSEAARIYVNGKTRRANPFFKHDCPDYDGSILALFAKHPALNVERAIELLNTAVDWQELGFVCDGRFLFTQRSLQTCLLPEVFRELLPKA
ncbi:class I SAM-dependent methyltransferase [Uliginosibacterium flavum]|uniref:site-specific DNA-methyltransferase (adenine-specific) n=1 Tax=Uliginosibacterium flavum TaxID=1396831 RepID=A0ABV2TQS1_9RHOO